ncbi:TetR family transcriptional regulator, partial [Streptomyces acidiscabies]
MRDALVAAAFRLFLERGYEQTTVDDIVALAGVGRRSFFRYFPSKEDVVFPDHERC